MADSNPDHPRNNRRPLIAFGITAESQDRSLTSSVNDTGNWQLSTFGYDDSSTPELTESQIVEHADSDEVSTQSFHGRLGCGGCAVIVTNICDASFRYIRQTACIQACAPFISSGPGVASCGAVCSVLVQAVTKQGCGLGAHQICENLDFC